MHKFSTSTSGAEFCIKLNPPAGGESRRDASPLFDAAARTVNARLFLDALEAVLRRFCDDSKTLPWGGPEWTNVRKKMNAIVRNVETAG